MRDPGSCSRTRQRGAPRSAGGGEAETTRSTTAPTRRLIAQVVTRPSPSSKSLPAAPCKSSITTLEPLRLTRLQRGKARSVRRVRRKRRRRLEWSDDVMSRDVRHLPLHQRRQRRSVPAHPGARSRCGVDTRVGDSGGSPSLAIGVGGENPNPLRRARRRRANRRIVPLAPQPARWRFRRGRSRSATRVVRHERPAHVDVDTSRQAGCSRSRDWRRDRRYE